jgi:hypothetical protein
MNVLAGIAGAMAFVSLMLSLWDRNISMAVADFSTVIWTVLYIFKEE